MILNTSRLRCPRAETGHSLPESIIAVLVVGMMLISLYAGFSSGFSVVQSAREELRATQIILQRMEAIRLYTWSQVLDTNNYLKPTFVEYYNPRGQTNGSGGAVYVGSILTGPPAAVSAPYRTNMLEVTVKVYWTNYNGSLVILRSRQMQTYVAHYGMQNSLMAK